MLDTVYVISEWDDSYECTLLIGSTDLLLMQDIVLSLFQESEYETFCYGIDDGEDLDFVLEDLCLRPVDCNYFISEVPIYGGKKLSES